MVVGHLQGGLSWMRFRRARYLEWRATATLLKAIKMSRQAEALRQEEMGIWGVSTVPTTWRPPPSGRQRDRRRRASEAFGDGTRHLGTIITNELGHQVYGKGLGFIGNFNTLDDARKALTQLADCRSGY